MAALDNQAGAGTMHSLAFCRNTPAGSLYVVSGAILSCTPKGTRDQTGVKALCLQKETRNKPTAEEEQRAVPFLILARGGGGVPRAENGSVPGGWCRPTSTPRVRP